MGASAQASYNAFGGSLYAQLGLMMGKGFRLAASAEHDHIWRDTRVLTDPADPDSSTIAIEKYDNRLSLTIRKGF
jgi:hypothetical protein